MIFFVFTYDRSRSSVKTEVGRLLRLKLVVSDDLYRSEGNSALGDDLTTRFKSFIAQNDKNAG